MVLRGSITDSLHAHADMDGFRGINHLEKTLQDSIP